MLKGAGEREFVMAGLESIMEKACKNVLENAKELAAKGKEFDLRMGAYVYSLKKMQKHYSELD